MPKSNQKAAKNPVRCKDCGGLFEVCLTHGNKPCPMSPQWCAVVWCPTCNGSGEIPDA